MREFGVKEFSPTTIAYITALRNDDAEQSIEIWNELDDEGKHALSITLAAWVSALVDMVAAVNDKDPDGIIAMYALNVQADEDEDER